MDIGIIAPNYAMRDQVERLCIPLGIDYGMEVAEFVDSPPVARRMVQAGAKVLISRGGVGDVISELGLPVPVLNIPLCGFDIIRLLNEGRQLGEPVAIIAANDSLLGSVREVAHVLGTRILVYRISSREDVDQCLTLTKKAGAQVVIGGMLVREAAKAMGLPEMSFHSSDVMVLRALNEARGIVQALRREMEVATQQRILLNAIPEIVISFDEKGQVAHHNNRASHLLQTDTWREFILTQSDLASAVRGDVEWDGVVTWGRNSYACTVKPVKVETRNKGAVVMLHEVGKLQRLEGKVRRALHNLGHVARYTFDDIVHSSESMRRMISLARKYARHSSPVLIQAESGTGKELLAQSLHNAGPRSSEAFVAINCTALPDNLLDSELFGYVEGAFTGARKGGKPGLFELAHRGTLFLDEIGELPLLVQAKLLRVLEEHRVRRLGDEAMVPVDVRIICATNSDLAEMVSRKLFRRDLYHRLNVLRLDIPPLRERPDDIPLLLGHFLRCYSQKSGPPGVRMEKDVERELQNHSYTGNVREMKNLIERLVVSTEDGVIRLRDIAIAIPGRSDGTKKGETEAIRRVRTSSLLQEEEKSLMLRVLEECGNNKAEAARRLGISPATLWRRLRAWKDVLPKNWTVE
jgi:transcriptional regulator with PAS, ATPase and Fis domain